MRMGHAVLWSLDDWAEAVAALPAAGPLPVRTVLVPSERHAHALRRALIATGRGAALAGTRLVRPAELAEELLRGAGAVFTPGEDGLRAARLRVLFEEELPLAHLDLGLLRSAPGWDEALAHAMGELEAAGLVPDDLASGAAALRDVATLWRAVNAAAERSLSRARVFAEATAALARGLAVDLGPVLATATGHESAAEAAFVRALPGVAVAVHAARPRSARHLERVERLWGTGARAALEAAAPRGRGDRELDLVARFLFAPVDALAADARPRSAGPDGTVVLEEHPGIEEELEAAADWVAREVLERGTPLDAIAVLVPARGPLSALVASRLARLPLAGGPLPVHVAGGLPVTGAADGARAVAVLRALAEHLPAARLAAILPSLRLVRPPDAAVEEERRPRTHLSHADAMGLAWSLGTLGGGAAHPAGALEWTPRAAERERALATALERARTTDGSDAREVDHLERALADLRAVRPALDALASVMRLVLDGAPLASLAPAVLAFLERWVLSPGDGAPVHAVLADRLETARADAVGGVLRGAEALAFVEAELESARRAGTRFGAPAPFVGGIADAAGLSFAAVRVVGLCEGTVPGAPREDPVLPDAARRALSPLLPLAPDRVTAQLHGFDRAVRAATGRLALSAPRTDLDRTEHEPSSVFVDVGAALGRPDAVTGAPARPIPGLGDLRRDAFEPARHDAAAHRLARPVSVAAALDRAAATGEVPPLWLGEPALHPSRVRAAEGAVALGVDAAVPVPGLEPASPISASVLQRLLECPRRFLFEKILRWKEAAGAPPERELDPLTYGSLFHAVMEDFYRAHGAAFLADSGRRPEWVAAAHAIGDARFAETIASFPLAGEAVREKERARLRADAETFLALDSRTPRTFVDVERSFGVPEALPLAVGPRTLYVRGFIDRLDVEAGRLLVRDLKTGSAHPRRGDEEEPTPVRDVQLGLYGLVARRLAPSWGLPSEVMAAYVYPSERGGGTERAFRDDFAALEAATLEWLALAADLLAARQFPPTPVRSDCTFCPFQAVCGKGAADRAYEALQGADGVLARFLALKRPDEEDAA
jgi:hypothetical protein